MMKRIGKLLLCCCFMLPVQTIQAKNEMILLYAKQLPYVFVVEVKQDHALQVNAWNRNLCLPDRQLWKPLQEQTREEIMEALEQWYDIDCESYVELDMDTVQEDFSTDLHAYDMQGMDGVTAYFSALKDEIGIGDILHYQRYVSSNLRLSQYYDFYKMFQEKVTIQYHYAPYFMIGNNAYPMEQIYKTAP